MAEGESKTSSCLKILGIGCVVMVVLAIVVAGGLAYYLKSKGPELAASAISAVTESMLRESQLTDVDKEGVRGEISRLTTRLKAGEISMEQMKKLADGLQHGPLPSLLFLHAVSKGQWVPPGIPAEESAQASLNAQRLQRAAVEGKITPQALQEVFNAIPRNKNGDPGKREIKAEDWRPVMALIKKKADDAGIPNEPYQLELTQEVRKLIDQVLSTSS